MDEKVKVYDVLRPIKVGTEIIRSGSVELTEKQAASAVLSGAVAEQVKVVRQEPKDPKGKNTTAPADGDKK